MCEIALLSFDGGPEPRYLLFQQFLFFKEEHHEPLLQSMSYQCRPIELQQCDMKSRRRRQGFELAGSRIKSEVFLKTIFQRMQNTPLLF